jgi:hypothetical protein
VHAKDLTAENHRPQGRSFWSRRSSARGNLKPPLGAFTASYGAAALGRPDGPFLLPQS